MKVLYISGSLGLGHVTRDLAITNELRKLLPDIEIEWLAAHPATTVLLNEGEKLVPQYEQYANENLSAEKASDGSSLNLFKYLMKSRKEWKQNIEIFLNLIRSKKYDLVIGDETYEINLAMREHPELKHFPFVMIFDFVGLDSMTKNPLEKLGVYYWNRVWSHDYRLKKNPLMILLCLSVLNRMCPINHLDLCCQTDASSQNLCINSLVMFSHLKLMSTGIKMILRKNLGMI